MMRTASVELFLVKDVLAEAAAYALQLRHDARNLADRLDLQRITLVRKVDFVTVGYLFVQILVLEKRRELGVIVLACKTPGACGPQEAG